MKFLKQTLLIAIITICASFAVFAQQNKDDKKKTPPKDGTPPVGVFKPKKDEKPKDEKRGEDRNNDNRENRDKKPQSNFPGVLRFVETIFD